MPEELVPTIEPGRVSAQKPFHAGDQVALGRLDHQMKMIAHQTIRMYLPIGLAARFGQRSQKEFPVSCIPKNSFPPVAAIHHVVNRPFILHSELSCHVHKTTCRLILVNTKNRPVYRPVYVYVYEPKSPGPCCGRHTRTVFLRGRG